MSSGSAMRATSKRAGGDRVALDREQQHDREQEAVEGDRADPGDERVLVPVAPTALHTDPLRQVSGEERDAEEDQHRPRDLPDRDLEALGVEPEPARQQRQVEVAEERVGDDLEQRVERDEHGRALAVAAGEVVPDEHHRDAAGEADDDHPGAVGGLIGEKQPGEREHQQRAEDPVEPERGARTAHARPEAARARRSGPWRAPGTSSAGARSRSAG